MSHAAPDGILGHIRAFFERVIKPDLDDVKNVAEKVRELTPALERIAAVVTEMAKVDPGLAPEVVADVEEAAAVVARIAAGLAAAGM